jgi:hypothetical protein
MDDQVLLGFSIKGYGLDKKRLENVAFLVEDRAPAGGNPRE